MTYYNFDQPPDRKKTHAFKWDGRAKIFGREDVLPLWVADMDFPAPPCVQDAFTNKVRHGIYGYALTPDVYYEALINWLKARHGWPVKKEWVLHSPGVVPALNYAVQAYTKVGDPVIIQSPVYPPFFSAITNNQREVLNNPLRLNGNRYVIDWEDLEIKLAQSPGLLILCSPHNPVGRVWEYEELEKLGRLCLQYQVPIVADEIHGDLVYSPNQHIPLASISRELAEITITLTSASKTFNLAGLQSASVIISNAGLRQIFEQTLHQNGIFFKNLMGMIADEAAYREGGPWKETLIEYLTGNLTFLQNYIIEHIPGIKVIPPEGTYLVWLDCRQLHLDDESLQQFFVQEAGLGLNQGISFGKGGEGFMRINIACSRQMLEEAMNRLAKAVQKIMT